MPEIHERGITHLPGELLAHVFNSVSLCLETGKARACVPSRISCVSRQFRDVTLGIRGIWANVVLTNLIETSQLDHWMLSQPVALYRVAPTPVSLCKKSSLFLAMHNSVSPTSKSTIAIRFRAAGIVRKGLSDLEFLLSFVCV